MAASGGKNYSEHTYKLDKFNDKFYKTKATVTIWPLVIVKYHSVFHEYVMHYRTCYITLGLW